MSTINIVVSGKSIPGIQSFLKDLPKAVKVASHIAYVTRIIGDERQGLKQEPDYRYATRKAAYGKSFQSDKQRRWFFWALNTGLIKPGSGSREHAIQNGWAFSGTPGNRMTIKNSAPGVRWVMGEEQARQPKLAGWNKASAIRLRDHADAMRVAQYAANKRILELRK